MTFGPKFTDLHSYQKERQLQKSCVSFGEECITTESVPYHMSYSAGILFRSKL